MTAKQSAVIPFEARSIERTHDGGYLFIFVNDEYGITWTRWRLREDAPRCQTWEMKPCPEKGWPGFTASNRNMFLKYMRSIRRKQGVRL